LPVVVVAPTGFPELPGREGLGPVYLETIGLEVFLDIVDTVRGNNNIIPIDAYLSQSERT